MVHLVHFSPCSVGVCVFFCFLGFFFLVKHIVLIITTTVNMSKLGSYLQEYKLLFEGAGSNPGDKTLEDRFFEHEVRRDPTYTCMYTGFILTPAQSWLRRGFTVHMKRFKSNILHILQAFIHICNFLHMVTDSLLAVLEYDNMKLL